MTWDRIRKGPPHDTCDWVRIDVHIRRLSDGVERIYHTDGVLNDDDATLSTYIWEEGNFACDCNRYLFFQRSVDEREIEEEGPCGDDAYLVWIVNPATGAVVYDERQAPNPRAESASGDKP